MYVQGKIKLLLLLSATNVSQFAQLKKHHGQQCVRNNVSSFTRAFTLKELNCSCFCHIINILLTELSRSVWKNLDLGRVYRPHCVRSVLTTSVKVLPYRPPARLMRAKHRVTLT